MKLSALSAKHTPVPQAAITSPPRPGPTIRAALNTDEFKLTALWI
jgi:hypothetical protein